MNKSISLSDLSEMVVKYQTDKIADAVGEALAQGFGPDDIIENGLAAGARIMGERFQNGELFLTELVLAGETMKKGIEILKPEMLRRKIERKSLGKVVLGTVRGDIHDIGKGIVGVMLEAAGFEVIDLGVDVSPEKFTEKAREVQPHVLGMSALLSTTAPEQKVVMTELLRTELRGNVKVIVGGAAISQQYANEIGADGYSDNAVDAVKMTKKLVE